MDYQALALKMVESMYIISKNRPQRELGKSMRGEAFVMQYITLRGGPVAPSDMSQFMNISTARMAVALNGLEKKGLVTRRIDPADRRRILVDLTEKGREFATRQHNHMITHTVRVMEKLGEQDAVEFVRILGRLADMVDEFHVADVDDPC
jgi:MarR family transcriptional regulator, organic hydroperoxide resistance regulator